MNSKTLYLIKKVLRHNMKRIEIKKRKIGPCEIYKISLLCFDDKKFVLDDGVHALAYFHKDSRKQIFTNKNKCTQMRLKEINAIKNNWCWVGRK